MLRGNKWMLIFLLLVIVSNVYGFRINPIDNRLTEVKPSFSYTISGYASVSNNEYYRYTSSSPINFAERWDAVNATIVYSNSQEVIIKSDFTGSSGSVQIKDANGQVLAELVFTYGFISSLNGILGNSLQYVSIGSTPLPMSGSAVSAATYQWYQSVNGSPWTLIPGAISTGYQPGPVTVTTFYYRVAVGPPRNFGTIVLPGLTTVSKNAVVIAVEPGVPQAQNYIGNEDVNMNWVLSKTYDDNGNVIGEGKQFFDKGGRPLQTQSKIRYRKNETNVYTHVFASQSLRDSYGRDALSTLSAPIDNSSFIYKPDFVQNTNSTVYDYRHFDRFYTGGTETDKTSSPEVLGATTRGTLGWYYSSNNTWENYTPTTGYPFRRQTYYRDGTGGVKKSGDAGETFRSGSGHEVGSYLAPVISELDFYLSVRSKYFSAVGEQPASLKLNSIQVIARDQNGREGISVQDKDGHLLMSARAGTELLVNNSVELSPGYGYLIKGSSVGSYAKNLKIAGGSINLYESTNGGISYGLIYSGAAASYSSASSITGYYKIESDVAFTVSYDAAIAGKPDYAICRGCASVANGNSQLYFKLLNAGAVVVTGGSVYELYDMNTEQVMSFSSGAMVAAGYYKIVNKSGIPLTLSYSNGYADVSYHFYNQLGELIATIAPEGVKKLYGSGLNNYATLGQVPFITSYIYDLQGRLVSNKSADGGERHMVYRKDGKIRFSQNAEQQLTGRYSYTNYDWYGRAVESGEYQPDGSGIAFDDGLTAGSNAMHDILESTAVGGGLTTGTKMDVSMTLYDVMDNSHGQSGYMQDEYYLRGAVSRTLKYSSIVNNVTDNQQLVGSTWYNYNEDGNVVWSIKYINGLGYVTNDFSFNVKGQLIKREYKKVAETFVHYYEYDPATLKLWKVYTNTTDNAGTKVLQASYIYYLHGPLKRIELATDLQGIDYTYTLQGALKAINNSNAGADPGQDGSVFKADAFGMVLDYYPGDYQNARTAGIQAIKGVNTSSVVATESYAGNIKAMSWFSKKPASIAPGSDAPNAYIYSYDDKYQFTESTWGKDLNFTTTPASLNATSYFKETIKHPGGSLPGYDANGNILYLQRTDGSGTVTDKFSYTYETNKNRLASITHDNNGTPQAYATYNYDGLGQLTGETNTFGGTNQSKYIQYDFTGKVKAVYRDLAKQQKIVEYVYDELGQRVVKRNYNSTGSLIENTYYLGGVIYTQPVVGGSPGAIAVQEYEIDGGSGRIGVYYPLPTDVYAYQLTDHLGNVRAVVAKSGSSLEVRMYTDYYPYGMVIQQGGSNDYRYEYQGQYAEKDKATDWNAFELRMYDSRIGRWLSVDPYGQYNSPYTAMGNDPIAGTDPDGGWSWLGAWLRSALSSFAGNDPSELYKVGNEWGFNTTDNDVVSFHNGVVGMSTGVIVGAALGTATGDKRWLDKYYEVLEDTKGSPVRWQAIAGTMILEDKYINAGLTTSMGIGSHAPSTSVKKGIYIPETPLSQHNVAGWDIPLPDALAGKYPHTTLGGRIGSNGILYRQSATFTGGSWPSANGQIVPWSRVDWTNHGRPWDHPNPHQHIFNFNGTTWQSGSAFHFP